MFNKHISIIFQVIGSSLKVFGVAFFDELHIFFYSLIYKRKKIIFSLSLLLIISWQLYMIINSFFRGYQYSVVYFRYILVFIGIFFLVIYYRRFLTVKNPTIFIIIGFSYLIIFFLIIYYREFLDLFYINNNLNSFWWQDFLWVGSAYASYVVYIIVGLTFIFNNNFKVRILIIFLAYSIVVKIDSRMGLFLITSLFPFITFGLQFKNNKKLSYIKFYDNCIVYLGLFLFIILIIFNYNVIIFQSFESIWLTYKDIFIENDNYRDHDRINSIKMIQLLFEDNIFNFIAGTGLTSHQFELLKYENISDKIRPVGVVAILFDGGIIYLIIIIFCALNSIRKIINYALFKYIPTWVAILWSTLLLNSIAVLLITNVTDLMLWWAVILSGEIFNKKFMIYQKKGYFAYNDYRSKYSDNTNISLL